MKIKPVSVLIFLFCIKQSFLVSGDDWYKRRYEGWYFYEEKNKKEDKNLKKITPEKAPEIVKNIRKKLEELLSMAILDPTQENVRNYMHEQQKWVSQSGAFAKTWSDVILNHPILADRTPVTQSGIRANEDYENQKRTWLLKKNAEKYFLVLFFEGKDSLSPLILDATYNFSQKHGWILKLVSMDEEGLSVEGYGGVEKDQDRSKIMGVEVTPSLFIVDPEKNFIVPVGAGYISGDRIERNIERQLQNVMEEK